MLTTGFQLAAARALIGMDQTELAKRAGLSANTIRNMEGSKEARIAGRAQNVLSVQVALEGAGIEFLNHGKPGVRLREAPSIDHPKPTGPATDVVERMEAAIEAHRGKKR